MEINDEIKWASILVQPSERQEFEANLTAILNWRNRIAPSYIDELEDNEIFVFGSDVKGNHKGGAAKLALNKGWAYKGQKDGFPTAEMLDGKAPKSYAITTTDFYEETAADENGKLKSKENPERIADKIIDKSIRHLIKTARKKEFQQKHFLVTSLGTGIAGFTTAEMANKFKEAIKVPNIYLPMSFWLEILGDQQQIPSNPCDMVPCKSKPVHQFQSELSWRLALYCQWLRNKLQDIPEFDLKRQRGIIMSVERNCNAILRAVDRMYRGLPADAFQTIKDCFDTKPKPSQNYESWKIRFEKAEDKTFYRLREEKNNWEKKEVDEYGMFHLPYNLRYMAQTQRYSVPGYPSLYMGQHVFSCWEERGRPSLSNCLISRLESTESFQILDLTIPAPDSWTIDNEKFIPQVILFPFIIASTFQTYNNAAHFKPEYIIPQLLFQYVKDYAFRQNQGKKTKEVYGIKYTSVHFPGYDKCQDRCQYDNFVVPALSINGLYCKHLCELFQITRPFCEDYSRIADAPTVEKGDIPQTKPKDTPQDIFDKIESELNTVAKYPLMKIDPEGHS